MPPDHTVQPDHEPDQQADHRADHRVDHQANQPTRTAPDDRGRTHGR